MSAIIRKIVTVVEETHLEAGQPVTSATRKAVAVAVIRNPFAGQFVADLEPLMAMGETLGGLLGTRCVQALSITPAQAQSYGKAAMVGIPQLRPGNMPTGSDGNSSKLRNASTFM